MNSNGHKERPILFSGPMVRAILEGRKTQTRRVVKLVGHDKHNNDGDEYLNDGLLIHPLAGAYRCPYGQVGDRLWVRETFLPDPPQDGDYPLWTDGVIRNYAAIPEQYRKTKHVIYKADWNGIDLRWSPCIHMPRWASRITLEITNVRVERLQEVSEADAIAEGVQYDPTFPAALTNRTAFGKGWDTLNAKRGYGWEKNPWVWVIEFNLLATA